MSYLPVLCCVKINEETAMNVMSLIKGKNLDCLRVHDYKTPGLLFKKTSKLSVFKDKGRLDV